MTFEPDQTLATRLIFLGQESLADGLRLIGFECHPDPAPGDVERILRELIRERESAFVLVDDQLMQSRIPALHQVLDEGGRIVVIAIPRLQGPPRLTSQVAERLQALFGPTALEARESS